MPTHDNGARPEDRPVSIKPNSRGPSRQCSPLPPPGLRSLRPFLLLFLGLLSLLNAPFDWASLGLTRALLRRGLEIGAWWPYCLALVDACLTAAIIALLALTMVVGVQAFDALAVHGGGTPVLPLDALFNGIAAQPAAPEYLVALRAPSLHHDPKPGQSRDWRDILGARGATSILTATPVHRG